MHCYVMSQQKRGQACPKMLYMEPYVPNWCIVSISVVQNEVIFLIELFDLYFLFRLNKIKPSLYFYILIDI